MRRSGREFVAALLSTALWTTMLPMADAQSPIRIGATLAQTGRFQDIGHIQLRAYQLCVKHANEKGGILGRRLELRSDDPRHSPACVATRM